MLFSKEFQAEKQRRFNLSLDMNFSLLFIVIATLTQSLVNSQCTHYYSQSNCNPVTINTPLPSCGNLDADSLFFAVIGDYGLASN